MAKAGLRWSNRDLARAALISANTVSRFETGKNTNASTIHLMRTALEAAGIVFIDGDDTIGPGVQLRDPQKK